MDLVSSSAVLAPIENNFNYTLIDMKWLFCEDRMNFRTIIIWVASDNVAAYFSTIHKYSFILSGSEEIRYIGLKSVK